VETGPRANGRIAIRPYGKTGAALRFFGKFSQNGFLWNERHK